MKRLENKGITLVALVVTIIVLIILAGVSISLVLGQDGVVQKAKQGRDNYAEAARLENEQLANVDAFAMDIEAMIPSLPSDNQGTATGTITNMTGGDLEISATVSLSSNTNLERTKYVFTTSNSALGTSDESLYKDGVITQTNTTITKSKAAGTYYLHILATDTNGGKTEIISAETATSQGKKDFDYTGKVQDIALLQGNYKLEVWGAEGGKGYGWNHSNYEGIGGKGGFSTGNIELSNDTYLYIYVGGKGIDAKSPSSGTIMTADGGWNGGGKAFHSQSSWAMAGSGGGATDISIRGTTNSTDWNNTNHFYSRIIVAGAGAGSGDAARSGSSGSSADGGYGGGSTGGTGIRGYCTGNSSSGAGQNAGGNILNDGTSTSYNGSVGTFGKGADGVQSGGDSTGGGGGGGWYGGASGPSGWNCGSGGGRTEVLDMYILQQQHLIIHQDVCLIHHII